MSLTERGAEHLEFLRQVEPPGRRVVIDGPGRILAARDVLFCVASNLECGQPQPQSELAARLRDVADLLVELDAAAQDFETLRLVLHTLAEPALREAGNRIQRVQRIVSRATAGA